MSDLLNSASLVMVPSGYKEDTVYSVVPSDGSGDLAFTRASNGTRINSAGLVEVVAWNLAGYSEDFSNAYWDNYALTITANTTTAPNGTATADTFTSTGNFGGVMYKINQQSAGTFTTSVYVKAGNFDLIRVGITDNGSAVDRISFLNLSTLAITNFNSAVGSVESVGNGWYRFIVTFTSTGNFNLVYGLQPEGTSGKTAYFWGAQLNIGSTAKPYFPTTDRLNVPRLTYQNGGGGCPSLLLEKQSTNIVPYSETFENWTTSFSALSPNAVTANYGISPDGTQNADRIQLTINASNTVSQIRQFITTTATTYTASVWLKSLSGTPTVGIVDSYQTTGGYKVVTLTNEWVRYTVTFSATSTDIITQFLLLYGTTSNSADFLAWGFQVEQSTYPTSYIPTTSSSATRTRDLASTSDTIQTAQTFAGDFSLFIDFVSFTTTDSGGSSNQMILGGGNQGSGASYKSYVWLFGSDIILTGDNETNIITVSKIFNANQRYKLLLKRNGTTVKVFCDGVQVGSSATSSTSISIRSIGWSYVQPTYNFNGLINQVVLSATGFSDADCQSLTTI